MGKFQYTQMTKVDIDDRVLIHLQHVMSTKLRRGEPFAFTWRDDASLGGGRTTVWVNSSSALVFKYYGSRQPALNHRWLEALMFAANSPNGLRAVPEPEDVGAVSSLTEAVA